LVNEAEIVVDKVVDALTVPTDPEYKAVDEKSSDPMGTGPLDWNGTNEANFNPNDKPNIENNDGKEIVVTDGGQRGSSGGEPTNLKDVKEVYSEKLGDPSKVKIDTVWGNYHRYDNGTTDSTTTTRKYETSSGETGEKVIKKEKGSTKWIVPDVN
jgi:hypothetical protein